MNTAILILNWNGGQDTINCLETLLPQTGPEDYIFLIDNASSDSSIETIRNWFSTQQFPLSLVTGALQAVFDPAQHYYLVANTANLGFGAGNNVVLKQLRTLQLPFTLAWLLNNDAAASPGSFSALKLAMQQDKNLGAAGSLILNYPDTSTIQCSGVKHYKFFGVSKLVNKNKPYKELDPQQPIAFDYLNGASLMLNLAALEQTGYFDERFFLYSEELDLQLRLQEKNYKLHLALKSVVYHKLSGSTGANRHLFFYYYNTSAMLLSRKHYPGFYTFCAILNLTVITFIRTFPSFKQFRWGLKGMQKGLQTP